jgi:CBS domain-containing protein
MTVHDLLREKGDHLHTVTPDTILHAAADLLARYHVGALTVLKHGVLVGLLSERDLTEAVAAFGSRTAGLAVRDVMTPHPLTCTPETTVAKAAHLMTARRARHLPVVEEGRLVGIVSVGDVVRHRLHEVETETAVLRDYITATRHATLR